MSMANVEQTIEVNLPVRTVYNQWTQFEEFPRFMQGWRKFVNSTIRDCTGVHRSPVRRKSGTR